jgi:hypothetical protein
MSDESVIAKFARFAPFTIFGVLADGSVVLGLVLSDAWEHWYRQHWALMSIGDAVLFLAVLILVDLLFRLHRRAAKQEADLKLLHSKAVDDLAGVHSKREAELVAELDEAKRDLTTAREALLRPSDNDVHRFSWFMSQLPPQEGGIPWLKETFLENRVPIVQIDPLQSLIRKIKNDPRDFDNADIREKYSQMSSALGSFLEAIEDDMRPDVSMKWFEIPREWDREDPQRRDKAISAIVRLRNEFLDSYDAFLRAAQDARLSIAMAPTPTPLL